VLVDDVRVEVIPQTARLFDEALALYADRNDKSWSLTDCASFLITQRWQVEEALTSDRHFEQHGFRALLRD
jgi:predicted nucleic acid-binding protein